ncbi:MAG: pirin family protein [Pseudomonadota bacterium]
MIVERPSDARGHVRHGGWLDSRHTFSFGQYYDPQWMGFGPLRVINEDRVAGGAGFAPHGHANMEIVSLVLDGALAHRDSSGGGGTIGPGELQYMSAGRGVQHSEYNASATEPVHFLQIWIQPDRVNTPPSYAQRPPREGDDAGRWVTLLSPDGAGGSLAIRQDARLLQVRLQPGMQADVQLDPARRYWLQVARGDVGTPRALAAGDALGFIDESGALELTAGPEGAWLLLFDLPRD